jgi:nitrile hydratase subunit beta
MSRVHDVGGQTGFGPVPLDGGGEGGTGRGAGTGEAFHADWEARVYALNTVLRRRGVYNLDEFRDAVERIPPAVYLSASYYERWLLAIEALLAAKGAG